MNGHDLVREIIAKHGVDRYPDAPSVVMKLMEELGELSAAMLEHGLHADGSHLIGTCPGIRKEYGDVGLTLYALGNALGLELDDEMRAVVEGETRRFDG